MANTDSAPNIHEVLRLNGSTGSSKFRKYLLLLAIVLLVILAGLLTWLVTRKSDATQYKTVEARLGSLTVTVTATGNLQATNQVDVGSELSGIIASVHADYNDRVKVGQTLAQLDTAKLRKQIQQFAAALESARSKVLEAQATVLEARSELQRLKRATELSKLKVVSQHDLDAAEAALQRSLANEASARATVSQSQAVLEANQTDLAKAVIRSPINGIVLKRAAEPGQTVAASFQAPVLFTVAEDLTKMELHVDVDEADVGQVKQAQEATFSVDAYRDRKFVARISQVRYGSKTVAGVVTYETVLNVDNSDLSLRPGMTATAEIIVNKVEKAILIPNAALRFTPPVQKETPTGGGGLLGRILPRPPSTSKQREEVSADSRQKTVWTLQEGRLVAVAVTVGATDGIVTQVAQGNIKPGMALVTDAISGAP
jgi:HlyD family secretion protein